MITNYATLQAALLDWLQRPDLAGVAPTLVQMGERRLRRDRRVKRLIRTTLVANAASVSLPADFKEVESIWFDGPVIYGELRTVSFGEFAQVQRANPTAGHPRVVAFVDQTDAHFAPVPDASYTLGLSYWATVAPLTDGSPTNWLLLQHPDIYLYAALVESAAYLREDDRTALWVAHLEERLDELHEDREAGEFSGRLASRPANPIP
jgi:hypothetical protein